MQSHMRMLVIHGVIVILIGLFYGFGYGAALVGDVLKSTQDAWKLAHMEGLLNGMLIIVIGVAYTLIKPPVLLERWIRYPLIFTAYANVLAPLLAIITGNRGLEMGDTLGSYLVYFIFGAGVVTVLIGMGVFLYSLLRYPS